MSGMNLKKSQEKVDSPSTPGAAAKLIVRRVLKASLATLDRRSGHPYASLVTIATEPDGTPLLLISKLALHTQNLAADTRASLLADETGADADPLAGGRVTVIGRLAPTSSPTARRRFLARHSSAGNYADFPDFAFYALDIESAHFIGGFGRIVSLGRADLMVDLTGAEALAAAEEEIVAHMNEDHADAIALYATRLEGAEAGPWRMSGIDPEGFDIVCGGDARRVLFEAPVLTPGDARKELVRLAALARQSAPDA
jgi:hypothetical protein